MELVHGKTQIMEKVYLVKGLTKLLLGYPAIRALGLIHDQPGTFTVSAVTITDKPRIHSESSLETVAKEFPKLFTGLGRLSGQYTICLREGAKPFCLTIPRRVPIPLMKKTELEIKRLMDLDVIEPVDEPTEWCAPIVVVPKASGEVRLCVDLTKLNQEVKREVYPMPKVEITLGSIAEGSIYSKLDANSGFHQVLLDPESSKLTTFVTPFGRYAFKRLPYGISSAPEYFQKRMTLELTGLDGVVCHMDDILIMGIDQEQHDARLARVLRRIQDAGLTLNYGKCQISQSRLEYLGQVIDSRGICKDPSKVKAIQEFPEPEDITSLRRFLGMTNQLIKFCPNLAEHTKPLRDLLRRENAWAWNYEQQHAFDDIKAELSSDRVLAMYSPD